MPVLCLTGEQERETILGISLFTDYSNCLIYLSFNFILMNSRKSSYSLP